jgi:two-component system nitrogen regulation sensor histidine kinase NtrY
MASRSAGPGLLAFHLAWRALALGLLAFVLVYLLASTRLYATALVTAGVAALLAVDLARAIARADRSFERILEGLAAGVSETPRYKAGGIARSLAALDLARTKRQQEADYAQALLDTVSAALIVLDSAGRVTLANRAARALVHGAVTQLADMAAIGAAAAEKLRAAPAGSRQILQLADGQQVLATVTGFSLGGGGTRRLISLQRLAGDLDAVELKAWQDVSRVLAHEMMNSLTPIASLSESLETLLRDAGARPALTDSADLVGAVEAIKRRSIGLMNFVERYRQVAELPQPVRRPLRMDAFLAGIDHLMRPGLQEKGIAFSKRLTPSHLTIAVDPQLLEHAIINLLRNAADSVVAVAAPEIQLSCELTDGVAVISVRDNGRGLPGDHLHDMFVPFFTTKPGGSGIGLSLVRQIALAHGGQVKVEAGDPHGAVFRLLLPVNEAS